MEKSKKFKVAFGHIGLLFALITYTVIGGIVFRILERPGEEMRISNAVNTLSQERHKFIKSLVNKSTSIDFSNYLNIEIIKYEKLINQIGSMDITARWTYSESIFFASTVLTTIGYGNVAPVTFAGRSFCIMFALIGIPLTLTVIADLGKLIASSLSTFNQRLSSKWTVLNFDESSDMSRTVRSMITALAAIMLLLIYISFGAMLFTSWEEWSFFEGFYFCFITMTTIGFGDLVPKEAAYMLICALYILMGLALTSTIIELVRRQYAQSWRRMKELSTRLQGLSGSLGDVLRKIDSKTIDLGLLQELKDLKKTLALTRLETSLTLNKTINKNNQETKAEWALEFEKVVKEILKENEPVVQIIIYESSV